MPKKTNLRQLFEKKYKWIEGLPQIVLQSFGRLTLNFNMIVFGQSGNGKSNMIMQFIKLLLPFGKVLYVSLEEGAEATMQMLAMRHLSIEDTGQIQWLHGGVKLRHLQEELRKRRSATFVIIDSLQYLNIDYTDYQILKEEFEHKKSFIWISHANGKWPEGKTANRIFYDCDIKIRVQGYIAIIKSRLHPGGERQNYVIWEKGAKAAWGKKYKEALTIELT